MYNNIIFGIVLVVVILGVWYWYSGNQSEMFENNNNENDRDERKPIGNGYLPNSSPMEVGQPTDVEEPMSNPSACFPKDQLTPQELLPQDYSSTWAKCNPTGAGSLEGKNFLDAGWHTGINTVGQVLRNPNLQIRSEPPNPQVVVSPFLNTTITPDTNRRYFELGNC
jgi:hypothetical protein